MIYCLIRWWSTVVDSSKTDPKELYRRLQNKIAIANNWYEQNGMIVNPCKHQTIVLGNTDYEFSFPLRNSIDLLGVSIDNNLSFNYHISKVCVKVNNHELRFLETLCCVYIRRLCDCTFIIVCLRHFCGARNRDKLELYLNKRILRFIWWCKILVMTSCSEKAKTTSLYSGRIHQHAYCSF